MSYKQLTAADRGVIEGLLQAKYTQEAIAKVLRVHPATVGREIKGRMTPNGYFAKIAQLNYESQRKKCRKKKKLSSSKLQKYLCQKLEVGWSPEEIAGRTKQEGRFDLYVCKETIYEFIYGDTWAKEEALYQYLRYGRKKRKKQTGRGVHKQKIPNRVSIHERPAIVSQRIEYGHGEGDSVIYPNKYAINTVNELITGLVRFTKLERKTAELTAQAMKSRVEELGLISLTLDNGSEHVMHQEVGIPTYFADPYCSCQRGANENANGLLRGYLPKRTNIARLTQSELDDIAEELNNRPRKRLGYRTPNEAYQLVLKSKKGEMSKVAVAIRM